MKPAGDHACSRVTTAASPPCPARSSSLADGRYRTRQDSCLPVCTGPAATAGHAENVMDERGAAVDKQTKRRPRLVRVLALVACCLLAGLALAAPVWAASAPAASTEAGLPFIRNFDPRSYGAAAQNWSLAQDRQGVIYVGNVDGAVLAFDGARWQRIPVPNRAAVRSLSRAPSLLPRRPPSRRLPLTLRSGTRIHPPRTLARIRAPLPRRRPRRTSPFQRDRTSEACRSSLAPKVPCAERDCFAWVASRRPWRCSRPGPARSSSATSSPASRRRAARAAGARRAADRTWTAGPGSAAPAAAGP